MTESDSRTEFDFLPEQAAAIGATGPLPRAERLNLTPEGGRTISALRYGGDAPAVTFLHGAGLNAHTFDTTILALGLPALSVDLPGHGDSAWRDDANYGPRTIADDVADAIAAWTSGPQVLVGQSLGGLTAAVVAARHPELVSRLVIIDITPGIDQSGGAAQVRGFLDGASDFASREEIVERALAFGLGGSRAAAERGVFLNTRVRDDGRVIFKHHFANLGGLPPADSFNMAPVWEDLAAVTAPLTLIRGDRGYVTGADAESLLERVPGTSLITVSAGHNVQEDVPVDLGKLIAELAGGIPG